MTTITNDGSDIIKSTINVKYTINNDDETIRRYEIDETSAWIKENNYKKVGLQFPNELLPIAFTISRRLRSLVDCEFGIMPDTNYGGCCADEIGGEHFGVDAIVHYGQSCLTPTLRKVPVKWVFGSCLVSEEKSCSSEILKHIVEHINSDISKTCLTLLSDHRYIDLSINIAKELAVNNICVHQTFPNTDTYKSNLDNSQYFTIGSRIFTNKHETTECLENKIIVYICDEIDFSVRTTLLSLFHWNQRMSVYNPIKHTVQDVTSDIERFLRSRLHKIELAKAAQRVGLLVGTLSIDGYLEVYEYLSVIMQRAGKAVYPLVVGKINANKLSNYADLDIIVVINCMESCLQFSDRAGDYYRPVVTPYEMICALDPVKFLNPRIMPYVTDFRQLLTEGYRVDGRVQGEYPTMSLVSGRLLSMNTANENDAESEVGALVPRLDSQWSVSAIDPSSRSWFGLDPQLGKTEVSMITEGRSGIASGYSDEKEDLSF